MILPRGILYTIPTADLLTYIIHHIQERKNTIYLNTSGLSSPPRGYGIVYKKGVIRSSRSTITPHHQLKSPSGNHSIHFPPSNETSLEVSLLKFRHLCSGFKFHGIPISFVFRQKFVSAVNNISPWELLPDRKTHDTSRTALLTTVEYTDSRLPQSYSQGERKGYKQNQSCDNITGPRGLDLSIISLRRTTKITRADSSVS